MIVAKKNGFEVQSIHKCRNYNWCANEEQHCGILFSESKEKPINAFIEYYPCSLDKGERCNHYNCGVQVCGY